MKLVIIEKAHNCYIGNGLRVSGGRGDEILCDTQDKKKALRLWRERYGYNNKHLKVVDYCDIENDLGAKLCKYQAAEKITRK